MFKLIVIRDGIERSIGKTFDTIHKAEEYVQTLEIDWYLIIPSEGNKLYQLVN